jgi:hypothetical protein
MCRSGSAREGKMNLYRLDYEEYTQQDYTTSDGLGATRTVHDSVRRFFKARRDETAKVRVRKIIFEAKKHALRIERPVLARVIPLPKMRGVKTHRDINPHLEITEFICE